MNAEAWTALPQDTQQAARGTPVSGSPKNPQGTADGLVVGFLTSALALITSASPPAADVPGAAAKGPELTRRRH